MATEPEQDLTSQRARRRRALAGVLASAAIAVPGVAFAAGGDGAATPSSTASPAVDDAPALSIQDERDDGDRRDCPEEGGGSGSQGESGSGDSSSGSGETAL